MRGEKKELRNSGILSHIENKTADYENRIALGMRGRYGWKEFTYKGLGLMARKLARYIIEDLGLKKGAGIAILWKLICSAICLCMQLWIATSEYRFSKNAEPDQTILFCLVIQNQNI